MHGPRAQLGWVGSAVAVAYLGQGTLPVQGLLVRASWAHTRSLVGESMQGERRGAWRGGAHVSSHVVVHAVGGKCPIGRATRGHMAGDSIPWAGGHMGAARLGMAAPGSTAGQAVLARDWVLLALCCLVCNKNAEGCRE